MITAVKKQKLSCTPDGRYRLANVRVKRNILDVCNAFNNGIVSDPTLDQTDIIRTFLGGSCLTPYFPVGTYRCRNLYTQDNQTIKIDGTIKQIDGTIFDITRDAAEGQPTVYIENATAGELSFLASLAAETPFYYYYLAYYDDAYSIEGGGTGQVHHNGWISRLVSVDVINKTLTMADNIPAMPNYCGGALTVLNNPKISVLYNVFEVKANTDVEIEGAGIIDANRSNHMDVNPVWISGEPGYPLYAGNGGNFIECFNVREGYGFSMKDVTIKSGKDNTMMWHMDGDILIDNVKSYDTHNKHIVYLVNNDVDYPSINGLIQNCLCDGSDYEDGILGYANADNLTYLDNIVRNCPRNGYTFNRANSDNNYGENLDAYDCGVGVGFNRGGITDLLTVKNIYVDGGGRHTKDLTYQPAIQIRSQVTDKCGYIKLINVGIICELHTYAFQIFKAEEIEIVWEPTCADKYKLIKGKFSLPHVYGYFVRINSLCSNIVLDGGGVAVVEDFPSLFWIETGSTGVVIKNFRFNNFLSLGTIDAGATFQDNYFNGVFYATGYPTTASVIEMLSFDAAMGVTQSGGNVSLWEDQSDQLNDASQANVALQPTWTDAVVNGLPVITGDGIAKIMDLTSSLICTGDFSVFAVIGGNTTPNYMFGYNTNIYYRFTGLTLLWKNSSSHTFDHSNLPLTTDYFLHRLTRTSGQVHSYRDTIESLTGALANAVGMYINKLFGNGTNYGVGSLAELRVYAGTLTDDEISDIENALILKYDIDIPLTPPAFTGLILDLDAGLGVTRILENVSLWEDQSLAGNDASQGTLSLRPDWIDAQVNGLPIIKGDGIDDIMNLNSVITCNNDFTVIAVMGGTILPNYMFGYSSTQYYRFIQNSLIWRCSNTYTFDHSNVPLTTGYFIHHIRRVSGQVRSYRNNIESLTGAIAHDLQMAINKIFTYGSTYGGGSLAELIVYEGVVSDLDIQNKLTALSLKYNITI